ncbi:MAG: hypothetical protein R3277_00915 [Brumimicrobium sp.]|nr:hypothetical protein [Brumimicrobium sp.]
MKIAIIGDFNFTFNSHHATNLAIEHSQNLLDIDINYYWIRIHEAANFKDSQFQNFDGIWIAPGPYENVFFLSGVLDSILMADIPVFITGEGFKTLLEVLIRKYNLNPNQEKLISDNLAPEDQFKKIDVRPVSSQLNKLYSGLPRQELSSAQYSIYPQLLNYLKDELIDIEGINQFEEPEIISLKSHTFCVASMSVPQICSTREMPHPLVSAFINMAWQWTKENRKNNRTGS